MFSLLKNFGCLLCLSVFILSCGSGPVIESYNDDGTLYERYSINQDSIKHGDYARFYKNGAVAEKANYSNGKLDGKRTLQFIDGATEIEELYNMDSLDGMYKSYYQSGQVEIEQKYVNNKIQGLAKRYYESGQTLEEVEFIDNEENGPFVEYYENGQIEWKGKYLNGDNEFGILENYDLNGVLIKKMECDSFGVCKTIWTKEN